ncbi:MAG TPA: type II toxin-antitoxin system RelE/ParE family toxin [Candidatus Nanoarchaeia archaeon]|nr:type II toxin-antitoxin system RelE/ParE family toxin [Candidatus Nanoarchaeia archaeon]
MVKVDFDESFRRTVSKIKDASIKGRIEKLIRKIIDNPEIGKPMRHNRKGTREIYLPPFRLSYSYNKANDVIVILDFYHKDEQ